MDVRPRNPTLLLAVALGFPGTFTLGSAAATPAPRAPVLRVSPAVALGPQPITVSWRTTETLAKSEAYQVRFAGGTPALDPTGCVSSLARTVGRGSPRRKIITVRLKPRLDGNASTWCASPYPSFIYLTQIAVKPDGQPDLTAPRALTNLAQAQLRLVS